MATRRQNEKEFDHWVDLPDGGRRYWFERKGKVWGIQRIVKIVDADEKTLLVMQEICDDNGELYERHQKYPIDEGHEILKVKDLDEGEGHA
ncbi:MAG: hypothetical protein IAE80_12500 [Anaerolinea sp.]|nr:hypothetical protein [Anaerolinea sp.]